MESKTPNDIREDEDSALLRHFINSSEVFSKRQQKWDKSKKSLFIQLARVVNEMGMDWYFVKPTDSHLRFGRKERMADGRFAKGRVAGSVQLMAEKKKEDARILITGDLEPFVNLHEKKADISEQIVDQYRKQGKYNKEDWHKDLALPVPKREGYWPDEEGISSMKKSKTEPKQEREERPKNESEDMSPRNQGPSNKIYYGPPGTGKTYKLQQLLKSDYTNTDSDDTDDEGKRYEFVTFHQSYGYEEFVEGLRPVITESKRNNATGGAEHEIKPDATTATTGNVEQENESDATVTSTGDTECGIKPEAVTDTTHDVDQETESDATASPTGDVQYEIKPGVFLRLCEQARKNPKLKYAMVIDEINRGNISKIFGELITLLEVDKRESAEYPVTVTLPYSGRPFSVPSNVDVIGSMNTADRSLALIDTALRRRFEFDAMMPDPRVLSDLIVSVDGEDIDIKLMFTTLNKRIEALYDRDHTIGHAYFTRLKDFPAGKQRFEALGAIFKNKIIPLLEEYFFEDWQKIHLVLGDNQKSKEDQFIQEVNHNGSLKELFGPKHDLGQDQTHSRYELNEEALGLPEAYVGIYDPQPSTTDSAE